MSEFELTLPEIYDLTARQIHSVYFHPRDKDGVIQGPAPVSAPADDRTKLTQLLAMSQIFHMKPEDVERVKQRLEALNSGVQHQ
ncbi:hypothetical protein J8F10_14415 [Gemmata sp. G18]|uniref:Uncharacterized protein n=1 Tax=Gemmata palustris TaxID=2822762 RepID=A0ABS5BS40_9BACT|nr:hypothetical protein [Gemmata palustris]MBP3956471.1 hypothetical protein [Gemmata palustris]